MPTFDPHANFALTAVAVAPSPADSGTSLTLSAGDGALFPDPGAQGYNCTVWPTGAIPLATNAEIVRVTGLVGDVVTIDRTQEGTSARAILVGDQFALTITKKLLTDLETAVASGSGLINVSAGATSQDLSALTFANGSGVSFGLTGSVITATVRTNYQSAGAYLTTAMQSDAVTLSNVKVSAGGSSALLSALTLSDSNGLAFGLSAGTITGSYTVPTQTVQTQNVVDVSLSGNTAGVLALISSGTAVFAGGNNITLSQNGQSITISGANAGGAQTAISGIVVSDATYTSGTVSFSNAGNITINSSVDGATQYIGLSGNAAQTNQSAIKGFGVSNTGQTAGNTGLSTGIDWVLAGSQSITLSQSTAVGGPNTVWIKHPSWLTTAMASNRGSDFVQATAGFNGTNASGTIASNALSVSVAAQSNQSVGLYASSNTYLTSSGTVDARSLSFRGDKSITVGISAGEVLFSVGVYLTTAALSQDSSKYAGTNGAITNGSITVNTSGVSVNIPAQTNQTVGLYASSNTYLTSSGTVDARSLSFRGDKSITVGVSAGEVLFSVGAYLTTAALSQDSSKYAGINGAITGGSITVNTSGVSVNVAAQSAQTVGLYASSNTYLTSSGTVDARSLSFRGDKSITVGVSSGEVLFSVGAYLTTARGSTDAIGLNTAKTNVTWTVNSSGLSLDAGGYAGTVSGATNCSVTVNTSGVSVNLPAYISTQSTQFLAMTLGGNTAGTTTFHATNNATLFFNGGNNITLSGNGSTVTISAAAQTNQTLGIYASSNTTLTSSGTLDARSLSFRGIGIASVGYSAGEVLISVPAGGGGITAINVSAGATSNNLSALTFADSNGISFGISASTLTATVGTYNTVGTATTVKSVASANSVGTVTRWAAEDHAHAGVAAIGISTAGNTSGTTGSEQGTYWLQGGNNVTLSQITSNNGSHTLVVSAGGATLSQYANMDRFIDAASTTLSAGISALQIVPFVVPEALSGLFMRLPVSMSHVSTEVSGTTANTTITVNRGYTNAVAILTQLAGASSLSLGYLTSTQAVWTFQNVVGWGNTGSRYTVTQNVSYPIAGTTSNYTTSYAQSSANVQISSASLTLFTGPRFMDIPFGISLKPGAYWAAFGVSTSSGTTGGGNAALGGASMGFSSVGVSHSALTWGRPGEVTNSSVGIVPGLGSWSTNSAVMSSSSIQLASVSIQASHPLMYFQIQRFA